MSWYPSSFPKYGAVQNGFPIYAFMVIGIFVIPCPLQTIEYSASFTAEYKTKTRKISY